MRAGEESSHQDMPAVDIPSCSEQNGREGPGPEGGTRPICEPAAPAAAESMGLSVTPLVQISSSAAEGGPRTWKLLCAGLDTVDLGIYVRWSTNWPQLLLMLEQLKAKASGTEGLLLPPIFGGNCKILPAGKREMYRFHIVYPDFHMYLATSQESDQYPNTYVSLTSKTLWQEGLRAGLDKVLAKIAFLGGEVQRVVPSRVDPCADFELDRAPSVNFLRDSRVCRSYEWKTYMSSEDLETLYMGAPCSPIQLRLYNKYREIMNKSHKFWMLDIWQTGSVDAVWRVEFQIRRTGLKQFGIDTIDDLVNKAAGVWNYLTTRWFSLRLLDNENPTRRTMHPWWEVVQNADWLLGVPMEGRREFPSYGSALAEFFVARAAGHLPGYAARIGECDLHRACQDFAQALELHWRERNFSEAYELRAIDIAEGVAENSNRNGAM